MMTWWQCRCLFYYHISKYIYTHNIYLQPIHIIWYKWYWHNSCLEQYNTSNKIHINPARSQPYPNPKYISFNMWLWIQVPVRYPQVQECQWAPVHPWHASTHESVPLWELHRRWPRTKEGAASLCWFYRTGTCLQGILGYDQVLQRQKEPLWWQESKSQGCCLQT